MDTRGEHCGLRPTPRRGRLAAALALALAWLPLRPALAEEGRGRPGETLELSAIPEGEGGRVMALVAPWQDGAEVAQGIRFVGASIDREIACYLFDGARRVEACLLPALGARSMPSAHRLPLPAGATLVLRTPAEPSPSELALLTALEQRLQANASSEGLDRLWLRPVPTEHTLLQKLLLPQAYFGVLSVLGDSLFWLALLLAWLIWTGRAAIADLPGRGWPHFLALLGYAIVTRWTLPVDAPMTAWSWERMTTTGNAIATSAVVKHITPLLGMPLLTLDDLQSWSARVLSIATPLALLGHARKLFGSSHAALLTAGLLAASPHALRFAAADTQFNPSMFWSSVAFFWVYCALEARRPLVRLAHAAGLLPLLVMAMTARPLNVAYGPLMLFALWIATSRDKLRWRLVLAAEVAAVFAWATWRLLSENTSSVASAATLDSIGGALQMLFSPDYNPLFFWKLTPPAWPLLIAVGAIALIRGPWQTLEPSIARRRGIWLVCWLLGYIALHGVVVVEEPMNNARYHLHSLPAMAMLAGAGLWALWQRWKDAGPTLRAAVPVITAICITSPWLHQAAIQDVGFATMQQRLFLRDMVRTAAVDGRMPPGCTVIEVKRPLADVAVSKVRRAGRLAPGLRPDGEDMHIWPQAEVQGWPEVAQHGGSIPVALRTIDHPGGTAPERQAAAEPSTLANVGGSITANRDHDVEQFPERALISERGRALLAHPPSCLVFFESAECALAPGSNERHPACREILASGRWQLLAERRTVTRIYDTSLMRHLRANGDPLELRMWRRLF